MRVFIVRPFATKNGIDFERVDRELIQPAMAAARVQGGTTGLIARSGNIRLDMFERLVLADLVIADISIHNANVFYELGVRHALRDHPTILLRCRGDDVPFDLRTDRYLEYEATEPSASVPDLTRAIMDTIASEEVDSPVYLLLPELAPPSTDKLRGVPEEFRAAVTEAVATGDIPRLGLLAEEIEEADWAVAGRRLVGKAAFEQNAYRTARTWLESVVRRERDDVEANLLLAPVCQKLGDLAGSNAAIERVLEHEEIDTRVRAERRALSASNRKTEWIAAWRGEPENRRAAVALETAPEYAMVRAYEEAFVEDQNHFYSGLNALALRVLMLELIALAPEAWKGQFDDDARAHAAFADARRECEDLRTVVQRSLRAAQIRDEARERRSGEPPDAWLALSAADYQFLTSRRPGSVAASYREAVGRLPARRAFHGEASARQIRMFRDLGVFVDKADAALAALGLPSSPPIAPPPGRVIAFSGHRIDRPDRPSPRFPSARVAAAKEAIRERVVAEQGLAAGPVQGFAGGANGGDILFHEVCKAAGIPTTMLLALPAADYAAESVNDAGPEWTERYRSLTRELPVRVLSNAKRLPSWVADRPSYSIWNRSNLWLLNTALADDGADVTLIVLWDGMGGDGPGGTADMVRLAEGHGVKIIRIDPARLPDSPP
ncbi:MAG TPA: tetratricopeptide repeat-containing protein [Candidatus Binatia bacterium]|nr:tetratricopeptide repeat-containing protein [Candidatus Binatia bacterium]